MALVLDERVIISISRKYIARISNSLIDKYSFHHTSCHSAVPLHDLQIVSILDTIFRIL
jgi:hypothetical protein